MLDHDIARWLLVTIGLGVFFAANYLPQFRRAAAPTPHAPLTPDDTAVTVSVSKPAPYSHTLKTLADLMLYRQMVRAGTARSDDPDDHLPPLKCPPCKGSSYKWNRLEAKCERCEGTGELPGEFAIFPKCQMCKGSGYEYNRLEKYCTTCRGIGRRVPASNSKAGFIIGDRPPKDFPATHYTVERVAGVKGGRNLRPPQSRARAWL
jgi:hypothetical protein